MNVILKEDIKYRKIKWFFTGILVIGWMLLIGSFSAQNAKESGSLSAKVASGIVSIEERLTGKEYSEEERQQKITQLQYPIRKLAHMSEYAILAMLLMVHLYFYKFVGATIVRRAFFAWLIAAAYAMTDEIHQLFVPGRSGQVTDVCIDAFGALLGVLFFCICRKVLRLLRP